LEFCPEDWWAQTYIPHNKALAEQKILSMTPVEHVLKSWIERGYILENYVDKAYPGNPSSRRHDASAQSRALSPQLRSQRLRARAEARIAARARFARRLPIATPRGMVVSESGVLAVVRCTEVR
jgi:hypothetical protein